MSMKERQSESVRLLITFAVTFLISVISYYILYVVFGFGGGMLVNR